MDTFSGTTRRIVAVGIAALVLFAPLAFGSVETWAILVLETAIFALGALWLAGRAVVGRGRASTRLELPILAFTCLVLVQLAPMPRGLLSVLSPRPAALYARTVPGYATDAGGPLRRVAALRGFRAGSGGAGRGRRLRSPMPATYSVPDTLDRLVLFFAFAMVFFITADLARDRRLFRRFLVWIVFVGMGIADPGDLPEADLEREDPLVPRAGRPDAPVRPLREPEPLRGVHGARGAAGARPPADAPVEARRVRLPARGRAGDRPSRTRGVSRIPSRAEEPPGGLLPWTATSGGPKAVLLGFLLVLSLGSIFLSLSRGGMMATALTFALFSPLIVPPRVTARLRPRALAALLALLALGFGAAFWFGAALLPQRLADLKTLGSEPSYLERIQAWRGTVRLFLDHPLLGSGLGAFETAFAGYYPPGIYGTWKQAHNDYLQLLAEVGIAGMIARPRSRSPSSRAAISSRRCAIGPRPTGTWCSDSRWPASRCSSTAWSISACRSPQSASCSWCWPGCSRARAGGSRNARPPAGNRSFLAAGTVLLLILACGNAAVGIGRDRGGAAGGGGEGGDAPPAPRWNCSSGACGPRRAGPSRPPRSATGSWRSSTRRSGAIPSKAREGRAAAGPRRGGFPEGDRDQAAVGLGMVGARARPTRAAASCSAWRARSSSTGSCRPARRTSTATRAPPLPRSGPRSCSSRAASGCTTSWPGSTSRRG